MKRHDFFTGLLALCCLMNFHGKVYSQTKAGIRIPVVEAIGKQSQLKASDYFQSIEYIPLEFTSKCPISDKSSIRLLKDKILIYNSSDEQCYLFDRSTGRFISSVGHIGNDPEGASQLACWVNYDKNLIYVKGWKDILQVYKSTGAYQGRVRIPDYSFFRPETDFMFLPDNQIVQFFCHTLQNEHYLKFFTDNATKKRIPISVGTTVGPTLKDIELICLVSGDYSGEEDKEYGVRYFTPRNVNMTALTYCKRDGMVSVDSKSPCFWQTGRDYFFREPYNDTIYQIKNTALAPSYVLDLGKQRWEKKDRFKWKKDHSILVTNVLDCSHFLLINCVLHPYEYSAFKSYNVIWNKQSGSVAAAPIKNGFVNDIHSFMDIHPLSVSPEGDFVDLIPADKILEWFDENDASRLPASLKKLKSLKEDDNPVVVIMKTNATSSR